MCLQSPTKHRQTVCSEDISRQFIPNVWYSHAKSAAAVCSSYLASYPQTIRLLLCTKQPIRNRTKRRKNSVKVYTIVAAKVFQRDGLTDKIETSIHLINETAHKMITHFSQINGLHVKILYKINKISIHPTSVNKIQSFFKQELQLPSTQWYPIKLQLVPASAPSWLCL